jgi:uncharacterized membrane protein YraQ (UPF0718 family)
VVPIYRQLVRQGASLGAAIAFLVATPELEIAAVLLTWQLLGSDVAILRVAMASLLALGVGMTIAAVVGKQKPADGEAGAMPPVVEGTFGQRLRAALRFGYGPAVDNTASWILMGLLLSALLMPYIDRQWIASLPAGIDVPIAALLGLPLYVCATGSTPLAAMLLSQGLSPGAVLALLLTGPATNFTTFGMLARLHGVRVAVLFAGSMWIGTIALGYAANAILGGTVAARGTAWDHDHGPGHWVWLCLLGGLFAVSLLRQGVRPFLERLLESPANIAGPDAHACCDDDEHGHGPHAPDHGGHDHAGHAHGAHAHADHTHTPVRRDPTS